MKYEKHFDDVKAMKAGTDYLTIRIPRKSLKTMPEGYFFCDIIIKDIRGGKKI